MRSILAVMVLVMFASGIGQAQQKCKVEGGVVDQAGNPIVSVSITITSSLGTGRGSSDRMGNYSVTVLCTQTSRHNVTPTKAGYVFNPPSRPWSYYLAGPRLTGRKDEPQQKH